MTTTSDDRESTKIAYMRECESIVKNAYEDGYSTGKTWSHTWLPGGPWRDGGSDAAARRNQAIHAAWHRGFAVGRLVQKAESGVR